MSHRHVRAALGGALAVALSARAPWALAQPAPSSPVARAAVAQGRRAFEAQRFDEAADAFRAALAVAPAPETQYLLGRALLAAHRPREAEAALRAASASGNLAVPRWLAVALEETGQLIAAAASLERYVTHPEGDITAPELTQIQQRLVALREAVARVRIDAPSPGLTVSVDGADAVPAPPELLLDPGTHTLELAAPGCAPRRATGNWGRGERSMLRGGLDPLGATIAVSTSAPGATVRIDTRAPAAAPLSSRVSAGEHRIEVAAEGYATQQRVVTVAPGETLRLDLPLEEATGRLAVQPSVPDARVRIDDLDVGRGAVVRRLAPGEHRLAVSADGYVTSRRVVTVRAGAVSQVEVSLARAERPGWLVPVLVAGGVVLAAGGVAAAVWLTRTTEAPLTAPLGTVVEARP